VVRNTEILKTLERCYQIFHPHTSVNEHFLKIVNKSVLRGWITDEHFAEVLTLEHHLHQILENLSVSIISTDY
jgi:hypothetical protein